MRILKGFLKTIITIILVILITTLATTTYLKQTVTEDFIAKVLQEQIGVQLTESLAIEVPEVSKETLEKIKTEINNNKKINQLSITLTEQVLQDMATSEENPKEIKQGIKSFILENKNILDQELGKEIPKEQLDQMLTQLESNATFDQVYQEIVETKSSLTEGGQNLVKLYSWINSTNYTLLFIGGIIFCLICLAALKKSYYKWLVNLSIASIIAAIITALISVAVGALINLALGDVTLNTAVRIDIVPPIIKSSIIFGIGIVCLIAYFIIKKNTPQQEKINEVS